MKKEKKLPIELLICNCHNTEHQLIFLHEYEEIYETDDDGNYKKDKEGNFILTKIFPMCYVHVHLNKKTFLERLKYGIKYIFGHQSRYGAFDEFIFNPEDADKLQELVDHLKEEL